VPRIAKRVGPRQQRVDPQDPKPRAAPPPPPALPRPVVRIIWSDASHQQGPILEKEFRTEVILDLVGFLVRETAGHYTLAAEYCGEEDGWRNIHHIPKVNVVFVARIAGPNTSPPAGSVGCGTASTTGAAGPTPT
jgi:hypothetical protein